MKRYAFLFVLVFAVFSIQAAFAQDTSNQTVTLNDATPGIDVVVSTPSGTTGAVSLQLSGASVTVKDQNGKTVFHTTDSRIHNLELHFAPGSQPHTITIERLPGISQAYVTAASQLDLTPVTGTQLIATGPVSLGQELDTHLTADVPGVTLPLNIPTTSPNGTVTASFPGAPITAQLVDSQGVSLADLSAGQIDGLSLTLNSGDYGLTLLNTNTAINTQAAVSVIPNSQPALPAAIATQVVPAPTQAVVAAPVTPDCAVQVTQSSINLRSGPGTGYSILDYGFRGDSLTVGGTNIEGNWLLVGNANGSAWMDKSLGSLTGNCNNLTVYNIPYREAAAPAIIIQPAAGVGGNSSPAFGGEHEGGEHDNGGDD